jgi:hypothetical protein
MECVPGEKRPQVGRKLELIGEHCPVYEHGHYANSSSAAERRDDLGFQVVGLPPLPHGLYPPSADDDEDHRTTPKHTVNLGGEVDTGRDRVDIHEDPPTPETLAEVVVEAPGVPTAVVSSVTDKDVRHLRVGNEKS